MPLSQWTGHAGTNEKITKILSGEMVTCACAMRSFEPFGN